MDEACGSCEIKNKAHQRKCSVPLLLLLLHLLQVISTCRKQHPPHWTGDNQRTGDNHLLSYKLKINLPHLKQLNLSFLFVFFFKVFWCIDIFVLIYGSVSFFQKLNKLKKWLHSNNNIFKPTVYTNKMTQCKIITHNRVPQRLQPKR